MSLWEPASLDQPARSKACNQCGRLVPLERYHRAQNKDGRHNTCPACRADAQREYAARRAARKAPARKYEW